MAIRPVTISFTGDARAFYAEMNKVRGEFGALRGEASKISGSFSQIGTIIKGYLGFRAVTGTIRGIVNATAEAEAAQAQLNSALAAAGAVVKDASAEFQAHATQLQRTTKFGDEAVMQVQSLLLSFKGLSGDTVKRATESVLVLSTRMGIDPPEAAKLLGKALADPQRGMTQLARSGVVFSDGERERIKVMLDAGKVTEAQAAILAKLEKQFGGAATAARDTFGGALAGLNNAFGDLLEGGSGFNAASQAVNDLTEVLSSEQTKSAIQSLVSGLATVISLAAQAATGITLLLGGKGGNEAVDIDNEILALQKRRDAIQREINAGGARDDFGNFAPYSKKQLAADLQNLAELDREIAALEVKWQELVDRKPAVVTSAPATSLNFTTGGTLDEEETESQRKAREKREKTQQEELAARYQAEFEYHEAKRLLVEDALTYGDERAKSSFDLAMQQIEAETEYVREQAEERLKIEEDLQERVQSLREGAVNAGINLLQFMAQKSKAAAIALIAVNKAMAIREALNNTAVAATMALRSVPYPANIAAAAHVKTLGAIQVGLIAASGALEIGSVGSGGGGPAVSPGTPNNPIYTRQDEGAQPGAESQRALQVVFAGPVYGMDDFKDQLVGMIREEVDGRDVVMFSGSSRQAQELRQAA